MKNYKKYARQYYMPKDLCYEWAKKEYLDKAPIWCSVDLRDGNQALVNPMNIEEKIRFFKLLCNIGFKEIEIGFPAASDMEYLFLRTLIEHSLIPDDVNIQVLTQAREHIIKKTIEAMNGLNKGIIHLYNSVSYVQRTRVFNKSKNDVRAIATSGMEQIMDYVNSYKNDFILEYSPESFSATEIDYALDVCNAVIDTVKPNKKRKLIINLPTTVELAMPHIFASQVEFINKNLNKRDSVILSVHAHNDRGCSIADTELSLLAGAQRVEGTLFGNGERTGNADIVTLAMNMYSHGVNPRLDFSNLPSIIEVYEECTKMNIPQRLPYSGELVFAAFSGSHQDAIAKSMAFREKNKERLWNIPYLPIDPRDISRSYESYVIRINSQSGKGGVSYVLEQGYGLKLPKVMADYFREIVKNKSLEYSRELLSTDIFELFKVNFENKKKPYNVIESQFIRQHGTIALVQAEYNGELIEIDAKGNGPIDAVSNALKKAFNLYYEIHTYEQHALERSSSARVITYVGIERSFDKKLFFGAGLNTDMIIASIDALVTAINNSYE